MICIQTDPFSLAKEPFVSILQRCARALHLRGTVTVRLASEQEARRQNWRFRRRRYTPDVLAFPLSEKLPDGFYAGDILVCYPLARRQARARGHSLHTELLTLMIHGLLHLAGYDHEGDSGEMLRCQQRLLTRYLKEPAGQKAHSGHEKK